VAIEWVCRARLVSCSIMQSSVAAGDRNSDNLDCWHKITLVLRLKFYSPLYLSAFI